MSLQAQPLVWGHGARTFEVFLEPTCPFSVKTFNKLDALLGKVRISRSFLPKLTR